jgi:hypothetical protein
MLKTVLGVLLLTGICAPAQTNDTGPPRFVIEAVGTARAAPDVAYVLMKLEYDSVQARDAAAGGEKRLHDFLSTVEALKIPELTWRVSNNVITPRQIDMGITYTRNIVFTLPAAAAVARDSTIARIEDVGARFNSHCVTCISSG